MKSGKKTKNPNNENMKQKKKDAINKADSSKKRSSNAEIGGKRGGFSKLGGFLFKRMVKGGAAELRSNADEVNRLNVFPVPDGDTGDNMCLTVESGVRAIEGLDTDDLAEVMRVLSHGMLLGARGNSGVILSQFFKGVAQGFENSKDADPKTLGAALELGVKQAYETVMTPTEGTILTVAREAVEYAVSKINPHTTIKSFFSDFVKEMHASVERTPESLPALKEAGVVDSGGAGLFYLMDGFNRVLNGEKIDEKSDTYRGSAKNKAIHSFDENSEMKFSYCTELLVQLMRAKCDTDSFDTDNLLKYLSLIGDSAAAVKAGSVVKIHVHTLTPDKIIAYMLKFGEFIDVKIENMSVQHTEKSNEIFENVQKSKEFFANSGDKSKNELHFNSSNNNNNQSENKSRKKYGALAISSGIGIDNLFKELGADETIRADSGCNPSANDFLECFNKINAEHIFVFPNNSNIILAAEQAAAMYDKARIHVLKTKNIGAGYSALSVMNFDAESADEILICAEKAINKTASGYISPAIRNAEIDGVKITTGDTIGVIDKRIALSEKSRESAAVRLCKLLLANRYVLTVFKGKDIEDGETDKILSKIKKSCPEAEIYTIDSGQEIFPLIFTAE